MKHILGLSVLLLTAMAAQQVTPQGIIVNPNPSFSVRTWVDRDSSKTQNPVYTVGENIRVSVQVSRDAYVYIFSVRATGEISLILPNPYESSNFIPANQVRTYPSSGARYTFTIDAPAGQDRVLAVASLQPLSLSQIADVQRGEVLIRGADNLARSLSIVVQPLPQGDWVSDVAFYQVQLAAAPLPPVVPAPPITEHSGSIRYSCRDSLDQTLTVPVTYSSDLRRASLTLPTRTLTMTLIGTRNASYREYRGGGYTWTVTPNRSAQLQRSRQVVLSCRY